MDEAAQVRAATREKRWDDLARLSDQHFGRVSLTDPGAWVEAFAAAPPEWFEKYPRQQYLLALQESFVGSFAVGDSLAMSGPRQWVGRQDHPLTRDLLVDALFRLQVLKMLGRIDEGVALADDMIRMVEQSRESVNFDDALPTLYIPVGVEYLLAGQLNKAIATFTESERWGRVAEPHPAVPHARNYRAIAYALAGHYRHAADVMSAEAGQRTWPKGTLGHVYENASVLLPALLALGRLDEKAAAEGIERIDADAENDNLWWVAVLIRARYALFFGDEAQREEAASVVADSLTAHRAVAGPGTLALTKLSAVLADLQQAIGDFRGAEQTLGTPGVDQGHVLARASLARLRGDATILHDPAAGSHARNPIIDVFWANQEHRAGNRSGFVAAVDRAARGIRQRHHLSVLTEADPEVREAITELIGSPLVSERAETATPWAQERVILTQRELQVLQGLAAGAPEKQIAAAMFLSASTVKSHRRTLYRKLNVHTSQEAVLVAERLGLLSEDSSEPDEPAPDESSLRAVSG